MPNGQVVGLLEEVTLIGQFASTTVVAKCDTGAKRTSIDEELANQIGWQDGGKTVTVRSSNGKEKRPLYEIEMVLAGETHSVTASITDRSTMKYDCIIGRDILDKFLVDSSDETVA